MNIRIAAISAFLLFTSAATAQIVERWLLQIPRFKPARTIVDHSNNVIVVGTQWNSSATASGMAAYCYNQDQQLLWSWNSGLNGSDFAEDAELLPDGSLVVAGGRGARWHLVRLTPLHVQAWATTIVPAGQPIADDFPSRVKVDAAGNVYVCGYTQGPITQDARVTKLAGTTGAVMWSQVRGIQERWDRFEDMDIDASGNVICVGEVGDSDFDEQLKLAVVSFTPNGTQRWAHYLLGQWSDPDQNGFFEIGNARAVKVAPSGNIYLGGIFGDDMQFTDLAAIKISSSGAIQWRRQWNGTDDGLYDRAYAIALGRQEQLYLTGETFQNIGFNYFNSPVIAYDPAGILLWQDIFNSPPGNNDSEDVAMNILVDEFDRVIMIGSDWTKPGPDYFVRIYTQDGSLIEEISVDSPGSHFDVDGVRRAALAPGGKLFFAARQGGLAPINGSTGTIGLIQLPVPGPSCPADFNADGTSDFFDYLDFVAAFAGNSLASDFNADGIVDFFDYLDFVSAFATGC